MGNIKLARDVIIEGCHVNPTSKKLWLEAVRLQPPDVAKSIITQTIYHIPTSDKLWLKAANLETKVEAKRMVCRKALKYITNSKKLWKTAIKLEEIEDSYVLLNQAVECCPNIKFWIKLAELEEMKGAKHMVDKTIQRAISSLRVNKVEIDRKHWFKKAMKIEKEGAVYSGQIIIKIIKEIGIKEEDKKNIWLNDIQAVSFL